MTLNIFAGQKHAAFKTVPMLEASFDETQMYSHVRVLGLNTVFAESAFHSILLRVRVHVPAFLILI